MARHACIEPSCGKMIRSGLRCWKHFVEFKKATADHISATCPTCGTEFKSATPKKFCTQKCYLESTQFREAMVEARKKSAELRGIEIGKRIEITCLYCNSQLKLLPSAANGYRRTTGKRAGRLSRRKFCGTICWCKWQAERFDKHFATPEVIALPQGYDEFLTKSRLPCLLPTCDWSGFNLSSHMNHAHGIKKEEFKKMAGFNVTTGVVAPCLLKAMQKNVNAKRAESGELADQLKAGRGRADVRRKRGKMRLEGLEHMSKKHAANKSTLEESV